MKDIKVRFPNDELYLIKNVPYGITAGELIDLIRCSDFFDHKFIGYHFSLSEKDFLLKKEHIVQTEDVNVLPIYQINYWKILFLLVLVFIPVIFGLIWGINIGVFTFAITIISYNFYMRKNMKQLAKVEGILYEYFRLFVKALFLFLKTFTLAPRINPTMTET